MQMSEKSLQGRRHEDMWRLHRMTEKSSMLLMFFLQELLSQHRNNKAANREKEIPLQIRPERVCVRERIERTFCVGIFQ